ncbi:MAG: RNA polymerase sigma factor [Planctomycetes bacterium]|nr:RNA polymerase sigma factor [Planctomycetota bacterium]
MAIRWESAERAPVEGDLIRAACAGDRQAFSALAAANTGWVLGWLTARVRDADRAEDLAQEVFLKAFENIGRLRDPDKFRPWLFRIAANVLRSHVRSERRARDAVEHRPFDALDQVPSDLRLEPDRREALLEAIERLPAETRDALILKHVETRSCEEIARTMGITRNALAVRLFRARQALRSFLSR